MASDHDASTILGNAMGHIRERLMLRFDEADAYATQILIAAIDAVKSEMRLQKLKTDRWA